MWDLQFPYTAEILVSAPIKAIFWHLHVLHYCHTHLVKPCLIGWTADDRTFKNKCTQLYSIRFWQPSMYLYTSSPQHVMMEWDTRFPTFLSSPIIGQRTICVYECFRNTVPLNFNLLESSKWLSTLLQRQTLTLSCSLGIHGVSFLHKLSWRNHITSVANTNSKKLGMLSRFRGYFTPVQFLTLYRILIHQCIGFGSHVWNDSTFTALLDKMESNVFSLIKSSLYIYLLFYLYHIEHCPLNSLKYAPTPQDWLIEESEMKIAFGLNNSGLARE